MKMELVAALIHRPKIIFLDEPTIGLDFISQKTIRGFIRRYNEQTGATILLTSHYMGDIESLCKRAIIINEGDIAYDGELCAIAAGSQGSIEEKIAEIYRSGNENGNENGNE
jgi:ABC-2 type transport system ATP-binding protein